MSKPREPWWGYVKNVIRRYPEYKKQLKVLKSQQITPGYSKTGGGGKTQRKTEAIAIRQLPPRDQERFDAVEKALRKTRRMPDGELHCRLIEMTYFKKTHNMQGAAHVLHVDYCTALRWNRSFVYLVADYLGLT